MYCVDYAVARCPSVRHTPVLCLNGYRQYSDADSPRGVECKGYEKNHDFRPISDFISQMMQDRAVTMEGE